MVYIDLQVCIDQLQTLSSEYQIIMLHPSFIHPHRLFNTIMSTYSAYYVRFDGSENSAEQIKARILDVLPGDIQHSFNGTLLLDECDRVAPEIFAQFVRECLSDLIGARLFVASRHILYEVLNDEALRQKTAFIPNHSDLLPDYARLNQGKHLLDVRAFGQGHVMLDGRYITDWGGKLPRSLFFFFVDRAILRRDDIFRTFWPKLTISEATNVFHVTKRKIHEILGLPLVEFKSGFYRISADIELHYDVQLFNQLQQQIEIAEGEKAIEIAKQASQLAKGLFLDSFSMEWVLDRRRDLRKAHSELMMLLANAAQRAGENAQQIGYLSRAAAHDPVREDAALQLGLLYESQDKPADGIKVIEFIKVNLNDEIGVAPVPELRKLEERLRGRLSSGD